MERYLAHDIGEGERPVGIGSTGDYLHDDIRQVVGGEG